MRSASNAQVGKQKRELLPLNPCQLAKVVRCQEICRCHALPPGSRMVATCEKNLLLPAVYTDRDPVHVVAGRPIGPLVLRDLEMFVGRALTRAALLENPASVRPHAPAKNENQVRPRRRKVELAEAMRELAEEVYPEAKQIRLVSDNLNTYTAAAFYERFDAETARRLTRTVEFVHTPRHGSWLNVAEIDLAALTSRR